MTEIDDLSFLVRLGRIHFRLFWITSLQVRGLRLNYILLFSQEPFPPNLSVETFFVPLFVPASDTKVSLEGCLIIVSVDDFWKTRYAKRCTMDKQIAVNMQDGEVVSLSVDGVEYTDVEEIADLDDRAKVRAMISRMRRGEEEDGLDSELGQEFQADFAEAQRQGRKMALLFALVFGGIGVLLLGIAVVSGIGAARQMSREVQAPGEVVEVNLRRTRDTETGQVQEYYYPVVSFTTADGAQMEVQLADGSWPAAYDVGEAVTVLYDATRPREARIQSGASTLLLWLLPMITGFVGAVFAAVGAVVAWPRKHKPAWAAV